MNLHGRDEVIVGYRTLAGSRHTEPPRYPLLTRAAAVRNAGFTHMGAGLDDYQDDEQIAFWARHIRKAGARIACLDWISLNHPADAHALRNMLRLADQLNAKRINVGWCSDEPVYPLSVARRLKDLAIAAGDHEVSIAFEPVVFGSLSSVERVQDIIRLAGEPNIGTLIDSYHFARCRWDTDVSSIDPALVQAVQICGVDWADPMPSYPTGLWHESQSARRVPGEGDFPLLAWLHNLHAAGVTAPLEIEIISDEMRALGVYPAALRAAESWRFIEDGHEGTVANA